MSANPIRYGSKNPAEPTIHDLPPIRYGGALVEIRALVRRTEDGTWRARLEFGPEEENPPGTAEIFFGASEEDLWSSIRDLREHHLRDLYRSLKYD